VILAARQHVLNDFFLIKYASKADVCSILLGVVDVYFPHRVVGLGLCDIGGKTTHPKLFFLN